MPGGSPGKEIGRHDAPDGAPQTSKPVPPIDKGVRGCAANRRWTCLADGW